MKTSADFFLKRLSYWCFIFYFSIRSCSYFSLIRFLIILLFTYFICPSDFPLVSWLIKLFYPLVTLYCPECEPERMSPLVSALTPAFIRPCLTSVSIPFNSNFKFFRFSYRNLILFELALDVSSMTTTLVFTSFIMNFC